MSGIRYIAEDGILTTEQPVEALWEYVRLIAELDPGDDPKFLMRPVLFRGQFVDRTLLPKCSRTTGDREWTLAKERFAVRDFQRQAMPMIAPSARPDSALEWLALAQHHGLSTRQLHWTDSPFVALWFAINWVGPNTDMDMEPIVWAFVPDPEDIIEDTAAWQDDPLCIDRTMVVCPRHTAGRIRAQSGWFTLHHRDEAGHFVPLDEQPHYQGQLRRIRVSPLSKSGSNLRRQLYRCGISAGMLFPDLGGISESINQHIEFSSD